MPATTTPPLSRRSRLFSTPTTPRLLGTFSGVGNILGVKVRGTAAFVTGGSSGIGAAIVSRFRAAGARVVIADRLAPPEGDGEFVRVDVSSEEAVAAALG